MTVTSVSICSNALLMLGAQTINSFNDADAQDRAKLCANLYPTIRDEVLRSHPWNSCVKRQLLAQDADVPAFGYTSQFQLPADFLRVLEVTQAGASIDYLVEGRSILANADTLELRYVFANYIEDTWDSLLVDLVTVNMAAILAYPVTQSAAVQQTWAQLAELKGKKARSTNGQEDPAQMLGDEVLYYSRFGGFDYGRSN